MLEPSNYQIFGIYQCKWQQRPTAVPMSLSLMTSVNLTEVLDGIDVLTSRLKGQHEPRL